MKKILMTLLVLLVGFTSMSAPNLNSFDKENKELNKANLREIDRLMVADFSEYNLMRLLQLWEVPHYEIVMNQMKLETAYFTSNLFVNYNNLTGMHFPSKRKTYSTGYVVADRNAKVAIYKHWTDSVKDYVVRLEYFESLGYSTEDYYSFLHDTGYCELGGEYIKILKQMS